MAKAAAKPTTSRKTAPPKRAPARKPGAKPSAAAPSPQAASAPLRQLSPLPGPDALAPPADGVAAPRAAGRRPPRPVGRLVRPLTLLLVAAMALSAVGLALTIAVRDWGSPEAGDGLQAANSLLGTVSFGLTVGLAVTFCIWLHRILSNAREEHPAAGIRPGWAVGSFFVPLAHFVVPYLEVRKGWRADVGPQEGPLAAWFVPWALSTAMSYVGAVVGGMLAVRTVLSTMEEGGELDVQAVFDDTYGLRVAIGILGWALQAVAAVALVRLARRWSSLQEQAPAS